MRLRQIPLLLFALYGAASLSGVEVSPDPRRIDPAIMFRKDAGGISSPQGIPGTGGARDARASVFLRISSADDALPDQVRNLGGTARKIHPRIYAARLPADAVRYLSRRPSVYYIEADRIARPMLDVSRPAVSADLVQQGSPPRPPFLGENTFIGIVDTGLSGGHPDFSGRIAHTFSVSPSLDPLQDTNGHGTHVAGIAAGDGAASAGTYTGMAPGSTLLIGRAGAESFPVSAIIDAIEDLLQFAGAAPVAINLSLGLPVGPHDGTSAFETAVNSAAAGPAGSKRIITVAAGNERNTGEHFHSPVSPFGLVTLGISLASGATNAYVEIWADGDDEFSVTATMGSNSFTVPSGTPLTSSGGITISNGVSPLNGDTLISLRFQPQPGTGSASIQLRRTRNGGTGTVDGYIDRFEGTFQAATGAGTVTEPANAEHVIAVGSFDTKQHPSGQPDMAEGISVFSSFGPTRDGRIKPDITAPGFVVYSTRSSDAPASNYFDIIDNNYAILAGTSMATAHVTGIASLVWQSNPALTGAQMRERLKRTADPPSDGSAAPNNTWGYGKVNALRAVTEAVASITAPEATTPGTPVTLTSENSSGPMGAAITGYQWNGISGGSTMTFQETVPGDYPVPLVVTSGGTTSLPHTKTIRVNNVPTAQIAGPASDNVGLPVTFTGSGSSARDAGQTIASYRWVLVSRPTGSRAALSLPTNVDTVTFTPDAGGTYEVGLRVDDGLDNSALTTIPFTALGGSASASGGGGGGCSVRAGGSPGDGSYALVSIFLLLAPLGVLAVRKKRGRRLHGNRSLNVPAGIRRKQDCLAEGFTDGAP